MTRRQGDYAQARKTFAKAAKSPLDWPEMLWEAWLAFEHSHGSAREIQDALDAVERARGQVEARRAKVPLFFFESLSHHAEAAPKEAEQAGYQTMQVVTEQQAVHGPTTELSQATKASEAPMDIDQDSRAAASGIKRKAEENSPEDSKKARVGEYSFARGLRVHILHLRRSTSNTEAVRPHLGVPLTYG
jgi:squamous cell carcinoma antigen recognized by T-cells 3